MAFFRPLSRLVVLVSLGVSHEALAQSMKPGLWEFKSTVENAEMQEAMKEMQAQMEGMSPEERKQMEQIMGAQGLQMQKGQPGISMKVCMTPEKASKFDLQTDPNCKQKILEKSKSRVKFSFECKGQEPTRGEGTFNFSGDSQFNGNMWVETKADGETEKVNMTQEGKWLATDCGTVKPRK